MHLNEGNFWKVDFLKTTDANVIFLTRYVKSNVTMAINKFQRSRLTFDLSAKPLILEYHQLLKHSFLRNPKAN